MKRVTQTGFEAHNGREVPVEVVTVTPEKQRRTDGPINRILFTRGFGEGPENSVEVAELLANETGLQVSTYDHDISQYVGRNVRLDLPMVQGMGLLAAREAMDGQTSYHDKIILVAHSVGGLAAIRAINQQPRAFDMAVFVKAVGTAPIERVGVEAPVDPFEQLTLVENGPLEQNGDALIRRFFSPKMLGINLPQTIERSMRMARVGRSMANEFVGGSHLLHPRKLRQTFGVPATVSAAPLIAQYRDEMPIGVVSGAEDHLFLARETVANLAGERGPHLLDIVPSGHTLLADNRRRDIFYIARMVHRLAETDLAQPTLVTDQRWMPSSEIRRPTSEAA